jgi:hypothetical protein
MIKKIFALLFGISVIMPNAISIDLTRLLPLDGELIDWNISDSVKVFKGDELYNYIDGGAEVFMEYGFKQVAAASYLDKNNNQMQVEIYEMSDIAAAYGAYSFYLNGKGKALKEVTDGVFLDYYAVFWKSNMLTVISLTTPNDSLMHAVEGLAKMISVKMPQANTSPLLVSGFKKSGAADGYIKFFKGNVGLGNFYKFIPGNAFKFKEGIGYTISGAKIIVLKYDSEILANSAWDESLKSMQEKNSGTFFTKLNDGFSYSDYKSNKIRCRTFKNFIVVVINKSEEGFDSNFAKISKVLTSIK